MNLKEILTRPSPSVYSMEECCYVVEQYILQQKGQNVKINIFKNLNTTDYNHPIVRVVLTQQLMKLNQAFLKACENIKF